MDRADKVGVRELRQNLSVYLARVVAGETLEVTDRGHAVAVLAPLVTHESTLQRLKREGRIVTGAGDLLNGPRTRRRSPGTTARALASERTDRAL